MGDAHTTLPIGQQVSLPGHLDVPVFFEAARALAKGFECCVRLPDGTLEEAVIPVDEANALPDRNLPFTAWNAIAKLADIAGKVAVAVKAEKSDGLDKAKLQSGVIDPLGEANLIEWFTSL